MQKEHVQVLLASTPDTPVHEIEKQLEQTIGLDCELFKCAHLEACLNRLHEAAIHIDIILLDLTLLTADHSQNFLRKMQEAAPDTPVIAFTREEDRELGLYMVQEGASIISNPQIHKLEPNRLRDVIEHSWISYKNMRHRGNVNRDAVKAEKNRSDQELMDEKQAGATRLREKDQVIAWMSGGYSVEGSSKENKTD